MSWLLPAVLITVLAWLFLTYRANRKRSREVTSVQRSNYIESQRRRYERLADRKYDAPGTSVRTLPSVSAGQQNSGRHRRT